MLEERLATLGKQIGAREAVEQKSIDAARVRIEALREWVSRGVEAFHAAVTEAGSPHLRVELSPIRLDDKRVRAFEFELIRGRQRGIVVAKSRGEVTLVGPFKKGKTEGPCRSFPFEAADEIDNALGDFVEAFLEEAMRA